MVNKQQNSVRVFNNQSNNFTLWENLCLLFRWNFTDKILSLWNNGYILTCKELGSPEVHRTRYPIYILHLELMLYLYRNASESRLRGNSSVKVILKSKLISKKINKNTVIHVNVTKKWEIVLKNRVNKETNKMSKKKISISYFLNNDEKPLKGRWTPRRPLKSASMSVWLHIRVHYIMNYLHKYLFNSLSTMSFGIFSYSYSSVWQLVFELQSIYFQVKNIRFD